jgi:RNA-binding protein
MPLTGAAARKLRALAHPLKPVVHVGKHGVTDELVKQVEAALLAHELIKVKVLSESPASRHDAGVEIAGRTRAELAQVLGGMLILYKPHPKKPKIPVPKGYTPPPRAKAKVAAKDEEE